MSNAQLLDLAVAATASAVRAAMPFVGTGVGERSQMDREATAAMAAVLDGSGRDLVVAAAEGERDGVAPLALREPSSSRRASRIFCDPVDGTMPASMGLDRAFSVIAIADDSASSWHDRLPDSTSVFSIGSHTADVRGVINEPSRIPAVVSATLSQRDSRLATLSREDNILLMEDLSDRVAELRSGRRDVVARADSEPPYATIERDRWFAVGDATVLLPFEAASEIGRMGLVECAIQSGCYSSWEGRIVSRDIMKAHPKGTLGYLAAFAELRDDPDECMARMFTDVERARFSAHGLNAQQITSTLTPDGFGAGRKSVVAIAALRQSAPVGGRPRRSRIASPSSKSPLRSLVHVIGRVDGLVKQGVAIVHGIPNEPIDHVEVTWR